MIFCECPNSVFIWNQYSFDFSPLYIRLSLNREAVVVLSNRQFPSSYWSSMTTSNRVKRCWRRSVSALLPPHSWHALWSCPCLSSFPVFSFLPPGSEMAYMTLTHFLWLWRPKWLIKTFSWFSKFHSNGQVGVVYIPCTYVITNSFQTVKFSYKH